MLEVDVEGGGGWRVRKAGTMMKRRKITSGSTNNKCGSKQIKEYTKRKDKVWVGVFQLNRLSAWAWKRNTTPILYENQSSCLVFLEGLSGLALTLH